jgi:hypothetical protein
MGQQIEFALTESMHRVLVKMASFLPGLLAFIVVVVVFTAIGVFAAYLLRRILTVAKFDERIARNQTSSVADWSTGHSPTQLVARAGFWVSVFLGLILGITAFDASFSGDSQIAAILIYYLTRSIGAVLLLIMGTVIARFLARSVLIGAVNLQLQYARLLSLGVKWLVLVLTAAMVLDHLEIGGTIVDLAFGILFGGIVLTLSLAIGLGSRDLVSRSLEKSSERAPDPNPVSTIKPAAACDGGFDGTQASDAASTPRSTEQLRHF